MKKRITYDDALAHRNTLMGVGVFDAQKWIEVEKDYHRHAKAFWARDRKKRWLGIVGVMFAVLVMMYGVWLGARDRVHEGTGVLIATIATLLYGMYLIGTGERHLMSAFGPSDFMPLEVPDYPEVWSICATDKECLDYASAAMRTRGELLFIELVAMRHRSHQLRTKQEKFAGELTKDILSSTDPKVKQLLIDQAAAIEFYRNNPTAALFDMEQRLRRNAQPA